MFKKGDKVYSILRGWGVIIDEDGQDTVNPLLIKFDRGDCVGYPYNGKRCSSDLIPELYHTEPVITVPKRRVEHTGWIGVENAVGIFNDIKNTTSIYPTKEIIESIYKGKNYLIQQITYYTEE